jgi:hypothetical protein
MPDVEIRPFSDEHLDAAAALLRDRHERHLATEPLVARAVDYRAQLVGQEGVVALRDGAVRAYLLTLIGALIGLGAALLAIQFTAGLRNYWHWTIQFAASRRTPARC